MVVVRPQEPNHAADLVPLAPPRHAAEAKPNDPSFGWARAACGAAGSPAEPNGNPFDNGVPSCARVLQVLEHGQRLLRDMERAGDGSLPRQPDRSVATTDRTCSCWGCRTRHEARPSPGTIQRVLEGAIRQAVLPRLRARLGCRMPPLGAVAARLADRLLAPSLGIGRTIDAIETIAQPYGWSVISCTPLFEQCARSLGDRFVRDACDDLQLTTALLTLQAALDSMVAPWPTLLEAAPAVLVVTAPGEPHRLGADLAARALQHAGWRTTSASPENAAALAEQLAAEHFDALHIALSPVFRRDHWQARLARLIAGARAASRNAGLTVSVGGRLFSEAPTAWSTVGADTGSRTSSTLAQTILRVATPAPTSGKTDS